MRETVEGNEVELNDAVAFDHTVEVGSASVRWIVRAVSPKKRCPKSVLGLPTHSMGTERFAARDIHHTV